MIIEQKINFFFFFLRNANTFENSNSCESLLDTHDAKNIHETNSRIYSNIFLTNFTSVLIFTVLSSEYTYKKYKVSFQNYIFVATFSFPRRKNI